MSLGDRNNTKRSRKDIFDYYLDLYGADSPQAKKIAPEIKFSQDDMAKGKKQKKQRKNSTGNKSNSPKKVGHLIGNEIFQQKNGTVEEGVAVAQDASVPTLECRHTKKAINPSAVRKRLKSKTIGKCEECFKANKEPEGGIEVLWICLCCGHQGCGRYSEDKHALTHYSGVDKTGTHPLALKVGGQAVWCYDCDIEVPIDENPKLKETVIQLSSECQRMLREKCQDSTTKPLSNGLDHNENENKNSKKKEVAALIGDDEAGRIKGLSNLGNTCFFNSVMQNLAQTHAFQTVLTSCVSKKSVHLTPDLANSPKDDPPLEPISLEMDLADEQLTLSLNDFFKSFHGSSKQNNVNPGQLFSQVTKKAPRFRGFQQQDSHELLRYLLDGLRGEETKRLQNSICQYFGICDKENAKKDSEKTARIKAYHSSAPLPSVDRVFGGHLLQLITCLRCNHVSHKLEAFLDLSLPISDLKLVPRAKITELDSDHDLDALCQKNKLGPSKHQRKKEKKNAKRKSRVAKTTDVVLENGLAGGDNANASEISAENGEIDKENNSNNDTVDQLANQLSARMSVEEEELSPEDQSSEGELSSDNQSLERDDHPSLAARLSTTLATEDRTKYKSNCSISSCLSNFTAPEDLSGKNQFGCTNCYKVKHANESQSKQEATGENDKKTPKVIYRDAKKQYLIYNPPAVLTLHLKRFQQTGFVTRKLSKQVEFPVLLDISSFCCKFGQRIDPSQERILYSLYGIVSHSGGLHGGHYVAYVKVRKRDSQMTKHFLELPQRKRTDLDVNRNQLPKDDEFKSQRFNPTSGKWYYISDSHVKEVDSSAVLKAEAYLLFYERIQ